MFMQLERVDTPTPPATVVIRNLSGEPLIIEPANNGTVRVIPNPESVKGMGFKTFPNTAVENRLIPNPESVNRDCKLTGLHREGLPNESRFMLEENRDLLNATRDTPAITGPQPVSGNSDSGFVLPDFPDYTFASDGTPTRVAYRAAGPKPALGAMKPVRENSRSRYFSLLRSNGTRATISDSRIRDMLSGKADAPTELFHIDDFPKNYFDPSGTAYRIRDNKPCTFQPLETKTGRVIRRYRLFSATHNSYRWFTDVAVRRYRDGRCTLNTAEIPTGCVEMGEEFPDWAIDTYTGQPYRIASRRFAVYEPAPLQVRPTGEYSVSDFSGKRHLFSPDELLAYVGSPNAKKESFVG